MKLSSDCERGILSTTVRLSEISFDAALHIRMYKSGWKPVILRENIPNQQAGKMNRGSFAKWPSQPNRREHYNFAEWPRHSDAEGKDPNMGGYVHV